MSRPGPVGHSSAAPAQRKRLLTLDRLTPAALEAYFVDSWELHERLLSSIIDARAFYETADPLRHPLLFYLAHPAAFYVNKLRIVGLLKRPIRPAYEVLFAQGVDPASPAELPRRRNWPSLKEVLAYRERVRHAVLEVISRARPPARVRDSDPEWAILMGIEHERIHFETSSVLLRHLPARYLRRPAGLEPADVFGRGAPAGTADVPRGVARLGKDDSSDTFGWDDEYGSKHATVPPFRVGRNLVTNGEFLSFVEDAGYARAELWSEEGWRWRSLARARMPRFWSLTEAGLRYRATFEELPFPSEWPVEVNFHEARAYCRWLGDDHRLPSELEWARLLDVSGGGVDEDGSERNLHLRFGSPCPVGAAEADRRPSVRDVRGNVWQWLGDDFEPLPGFCPHLLYPDYSVPYFGRSHATLRGGSWATTGASASPWYRLWFRRHFYQHAGFRVARSL